MVILAGVSSIALAIVWYKPGQTIERIKWNKLIAQGKIQRPSKYKRLRLNSAEDKQ